MASLANPGAAVAGEAAVWLEAEGFAQTGGWSNDSQFVDRMGSPYLLATGLGKPVADAVTTAKLPKAGRYRLWVRCKDWLPSHSPGRFGVLVGGRPAEAAFGKAASDAWQWVDGGSFDLPAGPVEVRLRDQTGWWGRCDAVVLAAGDFRPADDHKALAAQRLEHGGVSPEARKMGPYDVVVIGGGPAGCGAAVAAARHGCRVALIQDRPVLGGNASSEIEIPPMGYLGTPPDRVNVTGLADEFFGTQGGRNLADSKHIERIVRAEKTLSLFLNTRAVGVEMAARDRIAAVRALDVRSGQRMAFAAPLFIDCTGHGWIGYYAGAEYRTGQEARAEFGESLAPVKPGKRTMGNSLYKAVFRMHPGGEAGEGWIPPAAGTTVTYADRDRVTVTGDWTHSTFHGGDYLHDKQKGKGTKTVAFDLKVAKPGRYHVFLGYYAFTNRATNVPVTVEHAEGKTAVTVDQTRNEGGWRKLGTFQLAPDGPARVVISTKGTEGYVVADRVRVLAEGEPDTPPKPPAKPARKDGVPFDCPPWAYPWTKSSDFEPRGSHRRISTITRPPNFDAPSRGRGRNPGDDVNGAIHHAWWVEYGGVVDTIDDAEKIRDELFRITLGLWNYAKNHNPKTVERNKFRELVWLNYVPGVRESRRLVGDHIMTQRAYDEQIVHPDTIAFTDWGIDIHHPEGFWVKGNDCIHVYKGRRTSIPYRTLYSRNIANLLMAGRCHSATHVALGGTRVMRPMCQTGQAAGTAAAIAARYRTAPRGVYQSHLSELQQALVKDGCYLMGIRNADEKDLALRATVTASSAAPGAAAGNVINGWNRVVGKARNAWAPAPNAEGPQWVRLDFDPPVRIDIVHVTFERRAAACRLEVPSGSAWKTVAEIPAGGPRRHVLRVRAAMVTSLRLRAAEKADDLAVCEIRAYREGIAPRD